MRNWFLSANRNAAILLAAAALGLGAGQSSASQPAGSLAGEELVYVGTSTGGASRGIYAYRFDPAGGKATFLGLEAETPNPTFLVASHDGRTLYAANEGGKAAGEDGNTVSAFRIDKLSGRLTFLNKVSSAGIGPCDLALAHKAHFLLVSNCSSGSVALLPILRDGSLAPASSVVQHHGSSVNPLRQSGPHAHGVVISLDDHFAFVADLGVDRVYVHPIDPRKPSLSAGTDSAPVAPGGGVRHVALGRDGRYLYSIDELDSALTVFRYEHGRIQKELTESTLPSGLPLQRGGSELAFDPSGRFLYASIRGSQNTITVFSVDPHSGIPNPVQFVSTEGKMPRHFALDLSGSWLAVANQNSHSIVLLWRDRKTGRLRFTHISTNQVDSPMCVVFLPAS